MEDTQVYYVDVLLPLHLPGTYTYRVPQEYNGEVQVGARVVVQFGAKNSRMYSAVVRRIHQETPQWKSKYIMAVLDTEPIVTERQMEFWEWMGRYYMCSPGDVMAVALPAGLKLASESAVAIHPDFSGELSSLTKYELMVVQLLTDHPVMRVVDISRAIGIQKIMPLIRGMIEREIVVMDEELRQRFTPRKAAYVRLNDTLLSQQQAADSSPNLGEQPDSQLKALFDDLERKKRVKQVEVLMQFLQLSHFGKEPVAKRELPQGSALQTLVKNGVLLVEERIESRLKDYSDAETTDPRSIVLNDEQQAAFSALHSPLSTHLLHGVTSSGKTEVYIKMIDEVVRDGHQALFLLPEIALTAQIINRLRKYFGNRVGVYHSRFSASERTEVWHRTLRGDYQVLLGARSAVFLPFKDLKLIIVDEEHDNSYKQFEPSPRYHARDAALYLARLWDARTVLGSATPSVETYWNAENGKYGLATITKRYGGYSLPKVECIDMKEAHRQKMAKGHFSVQLLEAIKDALDNKRQVILFQNRRGFSLRLECDDCHEVPHCVHCDVSLVYHKASNSLRCHYCGYSIPVPQECPACHSTHLKMTGVGTERIEEDLQILFPEASVARMDLDSTLQKNQYLEILSDFEHRRIDILVGTQMVTKGLDFERVSVVGIVNADNIINYPSFRSFERAFQQMTQVSGRAGRHGSGGRVIIQTYNPHHQVIANVMDNDYQGLYEEQIQERRVFRYPPFYRLIEITLKHRDADLLNSAADWMAMQLRGAFAGRVLGPEYPLVSRIRGLYLKQITLRFERTEPIADAKRVIRQIGDDLTKQDGHSGITLIYDVDPS
ncbi:MAG: primosomal protein N' [Bacteroidales bacterium]|nr:primosomal protein N' [Bacteroidales bacterium]